MELYETNSTIEMKQKFNVHLKTKIKFKVFGFSKNCVLLQIIGWQRKRYNYRNSIELAS